MSVTNNSQRVAVAIRSLGNMGDGVLAIAGLWILLDTVIGGLGWAALQFAQLLWTNPWLGALFILLCFASYLKRNMDMVSGVGVVVLLAFLSIVIALRFYFIGQLSGLLTIIALFAIVLALLILTSVPSIQKPWWDEPVD